MALACTGNQQGLLHLSFNQDNTCLALATRDGLRIYSIDTHQIVYRNSIGALGCAARGAQRAKSSGRPHSPVLCRRGSSMVAVVAAAASSNRGWQSVCTQHAQAALSLKPTRAAGAAPGRRLAEMLFCTSLVAYVGAGEQPALTPRKLTIMNTSKEEAIQNISFVSGPRRHRVLEGGGLAALGFGVRWQESGIGLPGAVPEAESLDVVVAARLSTVAAFNRAQRSQASSVLAVRMNRQR